MLDSWEADSVRVTAVCSLLLAGLLLGAAPARAVSVDFFCLTNNDPGDCAIGETQFSVEVSDLGGGSVQFHFLNSGPLASVLSEIYFDDGSLLVLSGVLDGPGVDFEQDANPPDLPGGETAMPPFQVTQGFLAEAVPSPAQNGAGPSEWVKIQFTLQGGQTFADVIDELTNGDLRIGIHVIGFGSGGSESFVNVPVPEPGSLFLLGSGLAVLGGLRRRLQPRAG
jgi:hypothetical protein